MPQVYIVVLSYKNWEDTLECLESVFRSSYQKFSVIVIDNDSQNNSLGRLMEWADKGPGRSASFSQIGYKFFRSEDIPVSLDPSLLPRLTFIQHSFNAGFAVGNNIALRLLQNEEAWFWLVNPDIVIQENTLEELVKFAVLQSPDSIIGGVIRSRSGNHDLTVFGGAKVNFLAATITQVERPGSVGRLDYVSGGCLFAHSSNLRRLGLLPEEYFCIGKKLIGVIAPNKGDRHYVFVQRRSVMIRAALPLGKIS
jgi:GT2 family glycosyltransferase